MSYDFDTSHNICEPLLLPILIERHRGNTAGDGAIMAIMRGLLDSPRTDAERAGERLKVFGWQVEGADRTIRWIYRVVGEDTGADHAQFTLTVPDTTAELPCRLLGLQLQITLNGVDATSQEELDCYLELAAASRAAGC